MDVIFNCSECNQEIEVDEAGVGQQIDCPSCNANLVIPPRDPNRKPSAPPEEVTDAAKAAETKPGEAPAEPPKEAPAPPKKVAYSVPQHDSSEEKLNKPKNAPAAPVPVTDGKKHLRTRTIRRNQCMEVGHDKFDEHVTAALKEIGDDNVVSITPVTYGMIDTVGHMLNDYGVLIVYKA